MTFVDQRVTHLTASVDTRFTITKPEYISALRRYYKTQLQPIRDSIAAVLAVCAGLYLYLFTTSRIRPWFLIVPGLILGLMVAYAFLWLPTLIFQSQPKLKSEYHLRFGDDAIRFTTDTIDSTLQWSTYHSWLRDNEFYILYHGTKDITVIPLRAVEPDANQQLAELLNRNIGPPKALTQTNQRNRVRMPIAGHPPHTT